MSHPIVHGVEVEVHLAGIFGFERANFQIDDDEAAKLEVVEKEVDVGIIVTDVHLNLPAHEGEAAAEFDEEILQVAQESGFEFAFVEGFSRVRKSNT